MKKIKVMSIFGTRPEAIKLAPVIKALQADSRIEAIQVVTGQHREMLDQVLQEFGIEPHADLDIMEPNHTLSTITRKSLEGLEKVLAQFQPDLVLVQGDTTTAFVAGLAAFYAKIPVGHVEAGLRTQHKYDPYPEEMNRRLLTTLADLHFPPTQLSADNLLREGIPAEKIFVTGNTVTDALMEMLARLPDGLPENLPRLDPTKKMLLVETHRRENLGEPMKEMCRALRRLVNDFTNCEVVFSVHKNPKVRDVVFPELQGHERIWLIEPVDYPTLIRLMRASYFILTDSGGIQEEAPSLGKPVLVLRATTERPEGVDAGVARLVGADQSRILAEAGSLLSDASAYAKMSQVASPYGDGQASRRLVQAILHYFGLEPSPPANFSQGAVATVS